MYILYVGCKRCFCFFSTSRSFHECMNSLRPHKKWVTKLSSAGLIYLYFGHEVLGKLLGLPENDPITDKIFDKVYKCFVEEVDAIDNGISVCDEWTRYSLAKELILFVHFYFILLIYRLLILFL